MLELIIRDNISQYMVDLKAWLDNTRDIEIEYMDHFFANRVNGYEEHMSRWKEAYQRLTQLIPNDCQSILDLGCGTGLELDEIFMLFPDINVTGIDLCESMLNKLTEKHSEHKITLRCEDYFKADFGIAKFDTIISFETLHHFKSDKKEALFRKIYRALKVGGMYIECDYIACCEEEEILLARECERKRRRSNIPDNVFVHFDTPLTLNHEITLLKNAGFSYVTAEDSIDGVTFITAKKLI